MADVKELNINSTTYNIKAKSVVDQNTGSLKFWSGTYNKYIGLRAYYDFYYANMGSSIYTTSATPQVGDTIYGIVIDNSGNRTATSLGVLVAVGQEGVYYQNGSLWVYTGVTPIEYPRNSGGDLANLIDSSTIYNVTDTGEIFKGTDSLVSSKVSKSGDTMTGNLTISNNDPVFISKNTDFIFGTPPSNNQYMTIFQGRDNLDKSMVGISNNYMSNGEHYARMYSTKDTNDNAWATIDVGFNSNNDPFCRLSSNTLINGEYAQITNSNTPRYYVKNTSFNYTTTTTPSSTISIGQYYFLDTNSKLCGGMFNAFTTGNNVVTQLFARRSISGTEKTAYLTLGVNSSGNDYCTFPNTTCCDGQWVQTNQSICSEQSLTSSTDADLPKTVTLPNDGYNYEVAIRASCTTGTSSGNYIQVYVHGNVIGGANYMVCSARTRTNSDMMAQGTVIIPMKYGSNNLTILRRSVFKGTCDITAVAYRRTGTNS